MKNKKPAGDSLQAAQGASLRKELFEVLLASGLLMFPASSQLWLLLQSLDQSSFPELSVSIRGGQSWDFLFCAPVWEGILLRDMSSLVILILAGLPHSP